MPTLYERIDALEKKIMGLIPFEGEVVENEDPEGLERVKVRCEAVWGAELSPWCLHRTEAGGMGKGSTNTPAKGDKVVVQLLNGDPDTPFWYGGFRTAETAPPEEFENPNVNGLKTESGIIFLYNDNDGSCYVETPSGGKVYLDENGKVITVGDTKLDEGEINIALGGPTIVCPVTNKPIPYSPTCFVKRS